MKEFKIDLIIVWNSTKKIEIIDDQIKEKAR